MIVDRGACRSTQRTARRTDGDTPKGHGNQPGRAVMQEGEPLKVFHYREGEHFHVPAEVTAACGRPQTIPLLEGLDESGNCPQGGFVSVSSPEAADYIVFPYVLEQFLNTLRALSVHCFLRELPFFRSHERKHVFFHCHDRGHPLFTQALILTCAPNRFNADDPFLATLPYYPGGHVLRQAPDFEFDTIETDTNFIGTLSWPVRQSLVQSIAGERGLRALLKHPDTLSWDCKKTSYLHMDDPLGKQVLEDRFVDAMRRSWTTLCPRGMGSSSVRFFEVLCMGRIPVHVSDAYSPPFEEDIDYSEFCLFIPEAEADRAGAILRMWLARRDREQRMAMCRKARHVWERFFRPEDKKNVCLEYLRRHLPTARAQGPPSLGLAPSPLEGDAAPRWVASSGFYANMVSDHHALWMNKGFEATPAQGQDVIHLNGVRSALEVNELRIALELARYVPENGTVACSGAPSGVLTIMLANGLIKAKNFSSLVYGVEDWAQDGKAAGATLGEFEANVRSAGVGDLVRPVQGGCGAAAFRDATVHLAVLAGQDSESLPEVLRAWLVKLSPGGVVTYFPNHCESDRAMAAQFAKDNALQILLDSTDHSVFGLRKPEGRADAAAAARREQGPNPSPLAGLRTQPRGDGAGAGLVGQASGHDGQGYLAVKATGGMGNRLLGLMCAVVYSLMTGRRLCVDWSDFMYSDDDENVFPRLFQLSGVPHSHCLPRTQDVYPEFWRELLQTDLLVEQMGIAHCEPAVMEATRFDMDKRYGQSVVAFWSYDLAPMQAALDHIREHLPQFAALDVDGICGEIMKKHLLPRPIVSDRVDAFVARHFKGPMIGLHFRHTDLRMPLEETVRVVQDLKESMGARIFLATDSQMIERVMSKLFGEALVVMPKRYPKNGKHLHSHRVEGMTNFEKALDAVVEMYLLSRCDALVRYQASTFAKISHYCSDIHSDRVLCVR